MYSAKFWTAKKIALLGTDSDRVIAKRLGVSHWTVAAKRKEYGIGPYAFRDSHAWGLTELSLLRTYCDDEIAKMTGRSLVDIADKRREVFK